MVLQKEKQDWEEGKRDLEIKRENQRNPGNNEARVSHSTLSLLYPRDGKVRKLLGTLVRESE